jgi:acetolactate synthase-1/2/3 large subunit
MRVAEYMVQGLRAQGVDHCFIGLGGLNDNFMPSLTETDGLRTIVAAFEGGAAFMADGYSRASGNLGVCLGIGGPGVLNMTTALAAAYTDRSSVLAISGEVPRSWEGRGGFQDASQAGINDSEVLERVTGLSLSISSASVAPFHLRQAITTAFTRRLPVHLSVPVDVQKSEIHEAPRPVSDDLLSSRFVDEDSLTDAVRFLNDPNAGNIVLLAGHGVERQDATTPLLNFAERFDIPVATTLSGKGVMPENHRLALGVFGYGGSRWAIDAICSDKVDILLVVGSALSQRDTMDASLQGADSHRRRPAPDRSYVAQYQGRGRQSGSRAEAPRESRFGPRTRIDARCATRLAGKGTHSECAILQRRRHTERRPTDASSAGCRRIARGFP